jgi:hypothetical protein
MLIHSRLKKEKERGGMERERSKKYCRRASENTK